MRRLLEHLLRCPFRQARMIRLRLGRTTAGQVEVTEAGKVIYKTEHNAVGRFPEPGDEELLAGPSRNFQVFEPLDFLAEVTQWSTTISSARTMRASSTEAMAASHHVRPPLSRPGAPQSRGDRSEGATGTAHQGKVPSEDCRMPRPTVPATVPPR